MLCVKELLWVGRRLQGGFCWGIGVLSCLSNVGEVCSLCTLHRTVNFSLSRWVLHRYLRAERSPFFNPSVSLWNRLNLPQWNLRQQDCLRLKVGMVCRYTGMHCPPLLCPALPVRQHSIWLQLLLMFEYIGCDFINVPVFFSLMLYTVFKSTLTLTCIYFLTM